ncbi:hypothetical protein [Methylogaea oryzae]|uniref:hypothetical protein n=1 Tax=Methylogaea oryzae TaxID=1295382 RepID=UPI00138ECAB3|nr:hypothetical protein [Methylogaea oryzae]
MGRQVGAHLARRAVARRIVQQRVKSPGFVGADGAVAGIAALVAGLQGLVAHDEHVADGAVPLGGLQLLLEPIQRHVADGVAVDPAVGVEHDE